MTAAKLSFSVRYPANHVAEPSTAGPCGGARALTGRRQTSKVPPEVFLTGPRAALLWATPQRARPK